MHREAQWGKAAPLHLQKMRGGKIYHNTGALRAARGQERPQRWMGDLFKRKKQITAQGKQRRQE